MNMNKLNEIAEIEMTYPGMMIDMNNRHTWMDV